MNWSKECRSLACRHGSDQPHAVLFPLIDKEVSTSRGVGKLVQVFRSAVVVILEDGRTTFNLDPYEVGPK